jgi:hypothetical protein
MSSFNCIIPWYRYGTWPQLKLHTFHARQGRAIKSPTVNPDCRLSGSYPNRKKSRHQYQTARIWKTTQYFPALNEQHHKRISIRRLVLLACVHLPSLSRPWFPLSSRNCTPSAIQRGNVPLMSNSVIHCDVSSFLTDLYMADGFAVKVAFHDAEYVVFHIAVCDVENYLHG